MSLARWRRRRRAARTLDALQEAGLPDLTPADLRVICLALDDRTARFGVEPAGIAAANVRAKMQRLLEAAGAS